MLLFLDIDGVMVPAKAWKSPEILNDGFPAFSHTATAVLQDIISEDVIVMLTTSHKSKYSIDQWKTIFRNRGLNVKHIKALPENKKNSSRKDEITNWILANKPLEPFVIIDDDTSLNDLPSSLKEHLILTSSHIGLTEIHKSIVKTLLREK